MVHSFLLIGQSNAAGRGFFTEAPPLDHLNGRLKVLRNGRWHKLFRPINPDRSFSGYSFAEQFAKEYACTDFGIDVGIIPAADGGTRLKQWMPGTVLFDHAVSEARLAMRSSKLVGVLWHQGECDSDPENAARYRERFETMIDALRKALKLAHLPVVTGEVGSFLKNLDPAEFGAYSVVNEALREAADASPLMRCVHAEDLASNPDCLHFSAASLKELGVRYYQAFREFDLTEVLSENLILEEEERRTELDEK